MQENEMKESLRPPDHQEDKLSFIEPEYARNTAKSSGDYLILVKGNSISRHGWNESTRAQGFYSVKTLVRRKRRPISDGAPKEAPMKSNQ